MRLTPKKIEEIMLGIIGEEGMPLIRELFGKENISEFDLANKTKKDIKIIRKMLYILYNNNLVGFTRKKDKIKGWYIYYWTLLPENIKFTYFKKKKEILEKLKFRLEEEQRETFFTCKSSCTRLNFDQATDFEFHCPECGELISQDETKEKIAQLEQRIAEIEEDFKEANVVEKIKKVKAKERKKIVLAKKRVKKAKKKEKIAAKKSPVKKIFQKFKNKIISKKKSKK
jgi:transcription initiation factor TFIIE subunit alpha